MSIVNQPQSCKPFRIHPERLNLEHAREEGYEILTFGDGFGEVYGPVGQHYTVSNFRCNCPDAEKNDGGTDKGTCIFTRHVFDTGKGQKNEAATRGQHQYKN